MKREDAKAGGLVAGRRIRVRGRVQGVGFRPFVWRLARHFGIAGEVWNDAEGVVILAAGGDLDGFETALTAQAPPLARVEAVEVAAQAFEPGPGGFVISGSQGGTAGTGVTPDAATCKDCLDEVGNAAARRFGYAFTNCTLCGPRFSILLELPYDRATTTMADFGMCAACRAEYDDPGDRRFHAQPVACPDCGPRLWLEADGAALPGDPIAQAAKRLADGEILAVKGLGGFHLACDAGSAAAIGRLRARKRRPGKPLALMGTLAMIRAACAVSPEEQALLADPAAPIVLLAGTAARLPAALAPGLAVLGWMLPYTPLHHLLVDAFGGPLVMTSGNLSGEPQVIGNDEARRKLAEVADAFLMHDRGIARRLDDSVERITPQGPMVLRRGRGRAPATSPLPPGFGYCPNIAAYGGQLKSAICLVKDGRALLSHHLGDLDDPLAWDEFRKADADYSALFDHAPDLVVCDLHPGYRSSLHAASRGVPVLEVQHHHAHLAACLAENAWPLDGGPVAGVILDGLGLGPDGTIWGGEVLVGDYMGVRRAAHLAPAPLPGGDAAQREPWRNALMRLDQAQLQGFSDALFPGLPRDPVRQAAASGINAPQSSSAGRLFDAMAACLGLAAARQSFEGEAAMLLEALATSAPEGFAEPYPMGVAGAGIDPAPLFVAWAEDVALGVPKPRMAARFHAGLARAFAGAARAEVQAGRASAVALSGGCFQNPVLLSLFVEALKDLPVLFHKAVPANDGGLALGQAAVAAARALVPPPDLWDANQIRVGDDPDQGRLRPPLAES